MSDRVFQPMILQTKQEIEKAIKSGKIKNTKYHLLDKEQKMFVELICFADYTPEQAMRVMKPRVGNARVAANRMLAVPEVTETINDLTVTKDKAFEAELSSSSQMALAKAKYIMTTTQDEAIALAAAKVILDLSKNTKKKNEKADVEVNNITYKIEVATLHDKPVTDFEPKDKVVIDVEPEATLDADINPDTGMPYVLHYEGVNLYKKE